jgi:hypothetical protein
MRHLLLTLAISFEAIAAPQSAIQLIADGGYLVAHEKADEIFRQCSRGAPEHDSELWTPSRIQIAELELALPKYLANRNGLGKSTPPKSVAYVRQYVGFARSGVRLIYANFLPEELKYPPAELRARPIVMCDGGSVFWGIVYNPATRAFEEPQFNGP